MPQTLEDKIKVSEDLKKQGNDLFAKKEYK
jgi:hypothetical protein